VMYFQNNTGNPQLDWLRTGLTEMVVTDLSQSPNVEILGTDRLVQILAALHRQNDQVVSFDTVQEIARRAGVRNVLLGSYIKSGDTLRITVTLQEAATGRIISSERIDSAGDSNLFPTVDDLTRRIKAKFSPSSDRGSVPALLTRPADGAGAEFFKTLSEVTTSSTEAYRYYAEAIDLHQRGQDRESVPLLEKALAIDPDFALAMTKLAVVEGNVGHWDRRDEFARRAVEHADRLAPRERYYIEGYYYSLRDETLPQGIDAYRKAIALYPDHASAVHNLGAIFDDLERYDEAVKLYEGLLSRPGFPFTFTFTNLAIADQKLGKLDEARRVLDDLLRRQPDNAAAYRSFGQFLNSSGKPDEALAAFAKADAIDGGDPESTHGRWMSAILNNDLTAADEAARIDQSARDAFSRWVGNNERAFDETYRGHVDAALALLDQNAVAPSTGSDQASRAASMMSAMLLRLGRPAPALAQARRALREARTSTAGWESSYYEILALSRLGQDEAAASALQALTARAEALPSDREKRQIHWLLGVMALDHHQTATAIAELSKAESMLPPKGVPPPPPPHAVIWFDLGSAYLAAGDDAKAEVRFQRVVDATESLRAPIELVRSLNFLSQIAARRGDHAKAREYQRRYLDYWKDSKGLSEDSKE
jgi:tetratricopeptide (TPR) repeat protein/TolB-like protein